MRITFVIQFLSLLYLTTNGERIIYPNYCYDHQSIILLSFSANFSYENFQKYLIDFADLSDCTDDNVQTYVFGTMINYDCGSNQTKRECIRQLLDDELKAQQCYDATKNTNGDIVQENDEQNRIGFMRQIITPMVMFE